LRIDQKQGDETVSVGVLSANGALNTNLRLRGIGSLMGDLAFLDFKLDATARRDPLPDLGLRSLLLDTCFFVGSGLKDFCIVVALVPSPARLYLDFFCVPV